MPSLIEPTTTALLVMDYQPALLGFLRDPTPLVGVANGAIDAIRRKGGQVGFVRVAFTEQDYPGFPPHSALGVRAKAARPKLDSDAPTSDLHPDLAAKSDDLVVRKTRVGAFSTTDLDAQLSKAGIATVVLAGVHTSGVVLTTVREAHDLDYRVVVLADACADPDPDVHEFLVDRIFPNQGRVVTTAEILGELG